MTHPHHGEHPHRRHLKRRIGRICSPTLFIASALLLQSGHPGSMVVAATSDLNLQTKLAAVRLPFIEPA